MVTARIRTNRARGLGVIAVWITAIGVCTHTDHDLVTAAAAIVATFLICGLATELRLVYRLAMCHGWRLRDRGLDIHGRPLAAPDPRHDIDTTGGHSTSRSRP